jgi:hypothetical protein
LEVLIQSAQQTLDEADEALSEARAACEVAP